MQEMKRIQHLIKKWKNLTPSSVTLNGVAGGIALLRGGGGGLLLGRDAGARRGAGELEVLLLLAQRVHSLCD